MSTSSSPLAVSASALPLVRGVGGLALLTTTLTVTQHVASQAPTTLEAWGWAGGHVVGAWASLALGHRVLTRCYPLADLVECGATNLAAAVQLTAHRLAAAAIAGACWGGSDGASLVVAAVFTVVAWASVIVVCAGHRAVTRYADHEEIAAGNVAAALAAAGLHLAVALVVMRALQGPFQGWIPSLTAYGLAVLWVLVLWPLREVVVARVVLQRSPRAMDEAVAAGQQTAVGAVEGLGYLLTALTVASSW